MSKKQLAVGLRYGVVFELNENGRPKATGSSVYEGIQFRGEKAFSLTEPEPRRIGHTGEDRLMAVDYLPPTEPVVGEIRAAGNDLTLDALLTGVKEFTVGEADFIARSSDRQGYEPQVGLLLFQQALDVETKMRCWRTIIIPNTRCIPLTSGMDENPVETRYMLAPNPESAHLWGVPFSVTEEGCEEAGYIEGKTEYKPKLVAFLGDGTKTAFLFNAKAQAVDINKIAVFVNGEVVTSGITKAVTGITFGTAPDAGDDIDVFYEVA